MIENSRRKKVFILSDNEGLARAIALMLDRGLEVVRRGPNSLSKSPNQDQIGMVDLIVIALSSRASEPIVLLSKVSLIERIGQMPVLIVSDRPFKSVPEHKIFCLDLFDIDTLPGRVNAILHGSPSVLVNQQGAQNASLGT